MLFGYSFACPEVPDLRTHVYCHKKEKKNVYNFVLFGFFKIVYFNVWFDKACWPIMA